MRASKPPRVIAEAPEAFLLQKQVNGCSVRTIEVYRFWLDRLAAVIPDTAALDAIATTKFFVSLRERAVSASTYHQAYRTIKTFVRWLIAIRALRVNPLDGLAVRTPKTLPAVPTEEELAAVLRACLDSAEGLRNRATILVNVRRGPAPQRRTAPPGRGLAPARAVAVRSKWQGRKGPDRLRRSHNSAGTPGMAVDSPATDARGMAISASGTGDRSLTAASSRCCTG